MEAMFTSDRHELRASISGAQWCEAEPGGQDAAAASEQQQALSGSLDTARLMDQAVSHAQESLIRTQQKNV